MNCFVRSTLVALAAFLSAAVPARAQGYNPFQIGASAGIAFPTGDFGNVANTGYDVTVMVGYKPQFTPIAFRAEAAFNPFGLKVFNRNDNIPAFTGNLVFDIPIGTLTPYVIGGAGLYRTTSYIVDFGAPISSAISENDFGFNIGGGIRIPLSTSFETFIEARYNRVTLQNSSGTFSFIPVTFGVMF